MARLLRPAFQLRKAPLEPGASALQGVVVITQGASWPGASVSERLQLEAPSFLWDHGGGLLAEG